MYCTLNTKTMKNNKKQLLYWRHAKIRAHVCERRQINSVSNAKLLHYLPTTIWDSVLVDGCVSPKQNCLHFTYTARLHACCGKTFSVGDLFAKWWNCLSSSTLNNWDVSIVDICCPWNRLLTRSLRQYRSLSAKEESNWVWVSFLLRRYLNVKSANWEQVIGLFVWLTHSFF